MVISNIEVLKDLQDKGFLKAFVLSGLIKPTILRDIELYYYLDKQIKTGQKRSMAARITAAQFGVCTATVYNVVKALGHG